MSILSAPRSLLVRARDGVDGALHARRHRQALHRLATDRPSRVLFVCYGNVCRSPYAERALRAREIPGLTVGSVGFVKPGRPPADLAMKVAQARAIQHADHRSRTLEEDELGSWDAVFFFDRFNRAALRDTPGVRRSRLYWLGDLQPEWTGRRAILDPWGKSEAEFERVFTRIEQCLDVLASVLEGAPVPS